METHAYDDKNVVQTENQETCARNTENPLCFKFSVLFLFSVKNQHTLVWLQIYLDQLIVMLFTSVCVLGSFFFNAGII